MATPNEKRNRSRLSKGSRRRPVAGSFLLSRVSKVSARCTHAFEYGLASKLLCSAQSAENTLRSGFCAWISDKIGLRENVSAPFKKAVATGAHDSVIFAWAEALRHAFLHTGVRFFGIAGLVFSLYAAFIFLAKQYMGWGFGTASPTDLLVASVTFFGSFLLLFFGKPICAALSQSRLCSRVLIDVLGVDPAALRQSGEQVGTRGGLAFVTGTVLGILTLLFRPHEVVLAAGAILFCLCIPAVPEMGLLAAVIVLPFSPLRYTAVLTVLSFVGYCQKLLRLKRAFRFGVPELFLVLCIGAGALSAATTGDTYVFDRMLLFGCIWFLTVNLMTTERLFRKYIAAILYGGNITLLLTVVARLAAYWSPYVSLHFLPDGMSGTVLKCYLIMMLPVALMHIGRKSGFTLFALIVLNAYLSGSAWVCVGLIAAFLIYLAFARGAWFGTAPTAAAAFPAFAVFASDKLGAVGKGFSETASLLVQKYALAGVGSGDQVLISAALANGLFPDGFASPLYTRLLLDGGVVLLLLFLLCAFFALQRLFTAMRALREDKKKSTLCGGIAACAVLFLITATVTDVWSELRIWGIFWCFCSASSLAGTLFGMENKKEVDMQWL